MEKAPKAGRKTGKSVNQQVAEALSMRDAASFARGSAGLFALFATLARKYGSGEVVIPALCCESVALAALYAGLIPRFAEVSPETFCITPGTVAPLLSARTRAVVVVHLFGVDAATARFAPLRRAHPHVAFIEDMAHAIGGRDRSGRLLGGGLDYSLLSFADSKIIPGDGGMLVFGKGTLDADEVAEAIPTASPRRPSAPLALSLRNLVHGLADLYRVGKATGINSAFEAVGGCYRDLIICSGGIGEEAAVAAGFDDIEQTRLVRYRNYSLYRNGIYRAKAKVVPLTEGSTCWRCPVLFRTPEKARKVTSALRAAGIHASNHYFPLNLLIGGGAQPVSQDLSSRIVNLWTAPSTPAALIDRAIEIINGF